jgi:Mg-chelatase subunit ChlD
VLAAFLLVLMMMMLAFSVDLGYLSNMHAELKRATDAAALAGAGVLVDGTDQVELQAFRVFAANPVAGPLFAEEDQWVLSAQEDWQQRLGELLSAHRDTHQFEIQVGHWDPDTKTFTQSDVLPSTVRVVTRYANAPLFFAEAWRPMELVHEEGGESHEEPVPINLAVEAIARYQPRDIALVLDFSGSMNDDSELKRIGWDGTNREIVEEGLQQIYEELDSPSYGSLPFEPQFVTLVGEPPSTSEMPQITVEFRSYDVYVTSTKELSNVVMEFEGGTTERIEDLSSPTGAFRGTGDNYNKRIVKVWVKSGSNDSGDGPGYGERFEDDYDAIKAFFGLDSVDYPYPSGSWNSFIYYVKTNYNVKRAGYRRKYGFMTLSNYWLESRPRYSQTPDLWKVTAQPVTAVKDSTGVFMDYIREVDTEDRVALVIYNSPSENALVEHNLTEDFDLIEDSVQHRQAAHYNNMTNIGAGIHEAWLELDANARTGSFKMIVLMTDGIANRPDNARAYALEQADLAAERNYPIVTISLGSGADTSLMQQIADRTGGLHFNIPGMQGITDYEEQLLEVFRRIADHRPLLLVK